MATTKAPLFGLDASGTVGNALVFSKWRGRTYVRRHTIPANPKSGLQVGMRSVFQFVTQAYAALTAAQKSSWADLAASDNITLLNAQVRDAQVRARRNQGWRRAADEAAETTIDPVTGATATAQPKSLALAWTRPVANLGDWSTAIYMSTTTGFTPDVSNLILVQAVASITATIPQLVTGTEYFFRVRETGGGGLLGTLVAQFSGTPT